jgi:hypothetical protein
MPPSLTFPHLRRRYRANCDNLWRFSKTFLDVFACCYGPIHLCSAAGVVGSNSLPAHRAVGMHRSGFMHAMLHSFCPRAHRSHDDHQPSAIVIVATSCTYFVTYARPASLPGSRPPDPANKGQGPSTLGRMMPLTKADPARLGFPSGGVHARKLPPRGP